VNLRLIKRWTSVLSADRLLPEQRKNHNFGQNRIKAKEAKESGDTQIMSIKRVLRNRFEVGGHQVGTLFRRCPCSNS
jgi:hypothetical protein